MKVIIVYGFLGAGKTTLIRNLLGSLVEPGKVAVLLNDFGRVNVDGVTLAGQHLRVMPLASGCICCSLSGAFEPALEELHARWAPEWLVVEPTGVAAPYALEALIHRDRLARIATLERVVTVVDASRFLNYRTKLGEFYTAQIEQADLVLLNKADLTSPEKLAQTAAAVGALNLRSRVMTTEYAQVGWRDVLHGGPTARVTDGHIHALAFETCEVPLGALTHAQLARFFDAVRAGQFGRVYRAKGITLVDDVPLLINYVDGEWNTEPVTAAPTVLVLVGHELDKGGIVSAARAISTGEQGEAGHAND